MASLKSMLETGRALPGDVLQQSKQEMSCA